jgi:hypothetical protein
VYFAWAVAMQMDRGGQMKASTAILYQRFGK